VTQPLSPSESLAAQFAQQAADLAAPSDEDKFLTRDQVPVVRAYRALTYALLAGWALSAPAEVLPKGDRLNDAQGQ
jgi:hypothetical protein